jgi:hypothetical protein
MPPTSHLPLLQSGASVNSAHCPAGTCFAGADGCAASCSGKACCRLTVGCARLAVDGRSCTCRMGDAASLLDPLFRPLTYTQYKE